MIRGSLSCSPADPFLWLILYWVEIAQNGSKADYLKYLRMSYRLGRSEGWIAVKRNRIALGIFERLPPDFSGMVIDEFANLLNSGFYGEVVEIFTGPGWHVRNQLLGSLKNVIERHRLAFEQALHAQGYEVTIPKVERRILRPWQ